jgi:uncharacterized LabA/DUF88 family protein
MRIGVYVDGFNLYYGAVRDTPYKWLDLLAVSQFLFPADQIVSLKYFTALVSSRPNDPDKTNRQSIYIRALKTLPRVEVILGSFLSHAVDMVLASSPPGSPQFAKVLKTEEKGSDVNIAAHMINDGHKGLYDTAALITNDSDLKEAVRIVALELKLGVVVINPHQHRASRSLVNHATSVKQIRTGLLAACQLPPTLQDAQGKITKPSRW